MTTYLFKKGVYPNYEKKEIISKALEKLKRYNINIKFLLDDGILFEVINDDNIIIKPNYLCDVCFVKNNNVLLKFSENFDNLEFRNYQEELVTSIPILNF